MYDRVNLTAIIGLPVVRNFHFRFLAQLIFYSHFFHPYPLFPNIEIYFESTEYNLLECYLTKNFEHFYDYLNLISILHIMYILKILSN